MVTDSFDSRASFLQQSREGVAPGARDTGQGRTGLRIVWVLALSLALAALVTLGLWVFSPPGLSGPGGPTALADIASQQSAPTRGQ